MKIGNIKIRRRQVKKAAVIALYSVVAFAMIVWTVAPSLGSN